MKKFFKYFKGFRLQAFLAPLFKLLEASIDLIVPLIIASVIDKGINQGGEPSLSYIYQCLGELVILALVGLSFSICGQYFAARTAVGVTTRMRLDLFKKIQFLSFNEIDNMGSSSLTNRMTSDMNQVQSGINMVLRLLLRSPFVVLGAAVMASVVSPSSSLAFWISIPVLSVVIYGIMVITMPKYRNVQEISDDILNSTKENLSGIRVIRAFGNEENEQKKFNERSSYLKKKQINVNNISSLMNPFTYIIINIAICVLIYLGALKVNVGSLTQGQVIALYNYMSQILIELIKLANLIVSVTKALACQRRIQNVLDMESSLKHDYSLNDTSSSFIEFRDVSLKYNASSQNALSNISFSVEKGQTIGIIGGTGSGKSSLVNLIPHFYDATEGSIYIEGKNILSYQDGELRKKIGIVLQKASLYKGTIESNLRWGKEDASEEEILSAAETAQAKDVIDKKEKGLKEEVEQEGRNFSGGQKQRLSIARALVRKPSILILDDSSSALDYATDASLRKALRKLNTTTFIVSQRTSSLQEADKIIVLDEGKMVGTGTHEELLKNNKVYQEIYYSQFKKEEEQNG